MSSLRTHKSRLLLAVGFTLVSLAAFPAVARTAHRHPHDASHHSQRVSHKGYPTGRLAGHRVADLYAGYIGYEGVMPEYLSVDWDKRLDYLWKAKARDHRQGGFRATGRRLVAEYRTRDRERMSLATYTAIADREATATYRSIDWNKAGRLYHLDPRRTRALRLAAADIRGTALVAYAETELLPGQREGQFNRDYLDFLLRNGGKRFVESIPAVHDHWTSFGPYQFTSQAVFDARGERRGASKLNQAITVTNMRIPGSVMKLRGNEHVRAAYLFAVSNTADMVRGLNARQLATFERVHASKRSEMTQFFAVSHNKPSHGRRGGKRWLQNRARSPFGVSVSGASKIYARKTDANYRALRRH